jgi:hypothetical protein
MRDLVGIGNSKAYIRLQLGKEACRGRDTSSAPFANAQFNYCSHHAQTLSLHHCIKPRRNLFPYSLPSIQLLQNTRLRILSHSTMADNKKQPVSFDDIIKAGEQNCTSTCAEPTTNYFSRPSKAQERAARTGHLRQEPPPERSCSRQHQESTHWRQSGEPSRSEQGRACAHHAILRSTWLTTTSAHSIDSPLE